MRDEAKTADLKAKGVDVRMGDYHQPNSLTQAFEGVDQLLLISTSDMQDRFQQQRDAELAPTVAYRVAVLKKYLLRPCAGHKPPAPAALLT